MLVEIDGAEPDLAVLAHRALVNYGHFSALQVRSGRTRGLAAHLARLAAATRRLWELDLDADLVRDRLRHALRGTADASVRVDVFRLPGAPAVSLMVSVRPPVDAPTVPQRLRTVTYERPVAGIKHIGTFAQIHLGEQAERAGYDDALLLGADGRVLETTMANIGFVRAGRLIWPDGPVLPGITGLLLDTVLPHSAEPVHPADLAGFDAAFLSYSPGIVAVGAVDDVGLPADPAAFALVTAAYAALPWDEL
jgi:branched-subunit amino acid aminotransferase/4-amino-4-deoxychorismate lyase